MKYVNIPVWQLHMPVTDFDEQTQTNNNKPVKQGYVIQQCQLITTSELDIRKTQREIISAVIRDL